MVVYNYRDGLSTPFYQRAAMDFKEATDILFGEATATRLAEETGVSLNSISRARMDTVNRRTAPRQWEPVVRRLAEERIADLTRLVKGLADA